MTSALMCFISYSRADGGEFALWLRDELLASTPPVNVWMDIESTRRGYPFASAVTEAIGGCDVVLAVVTRDSSESDFVNTELTFAQRIGRRIVPLLVHRDTIVPLLLEGYQSIDFSGDRERGIAALRILLNRIDSGEERMASLQEQLAITQRRRDNATEQRRMRLERDAAILQARIAEEQQRVNDPEDARRRVEAEIESGLAREREPDPHVARGEINLIGLLPRVSPYFLNRSVEAERLARLLRSDDVRLIVVTGTQGIGKTSLVSRVVSASEDPNSLGLDGVVYLRAGEARPVTISALLSDLARLLPVGVADEVDAIRRAPSPATMKDLDALLKALGTMRLAIIIDNAEALLDPATLQFRDDELDQLLREVMIRRQHALKIVLVSRGVGPQPLLQHVPGNSAHLSLDSGLPGVEAEMFLRRLDFDGALGLHGASAEFLQRMYEVTGGHPRSLEALVAALSMDPQLTLEEVLDKVAAFPPEAAADALLAEVFARLDPDERRVAQVLAVYRRPVLPVAVDYLLQPYREGLTSSPLLHRLLGMRLVCQAGERYDLAPQDRERLLRTLPVGQGRDRLRDPPPFTQAALLHRAADYLRQAGAAPEEWQGLRGLEAQLTESKLLAGYVPDSVTGEDHLGIRDDVNALSSVLAARDVDPPLSVGLFGDWGSGKSFFMEQMRLRISELAKRSQHAETGSAYYSYIRQITFNAWHYADANLWASLVTHIFDRLASPEPEDRADADSMAGLQLETDRSRLLEKVTAARLERERLSSTTRELAELRENFEEQPARIVLSDVRGAVGEQVREELKWLDEQLRENQNLTVGELRDLADDFQQKRTKAKEVWQRLGGSGRAWVLASLSIGAVLFVLGAVWFRSSEPHWGRFIVGGWAVWLPGLAVLGRSVGVVRGITKRLGRVLDRLDDSEAAKRQAHLEQEQKQAQERVERLTEDIRILERHIDELSWGHQLYRFTEERSVSVDYRQHLGVVAMIRRDFEHMSTLLRRSRGDAHDDLPRFDRIILYIDDLDRCPPDRVVQVLEAVHLLLAIELFVVVVAVDPRWLVRSLEHHYAALLKPSDDSTTDPEEAAHWAATPMNYLEKIFQIPYSLQPLDATGYGRLIEALMEVETPATPAGQEAAGNESENLSSEDLSSSNQRQTMQAERGPSSTRAGDSYATSAVAHHEATDEIPLAPAALRITVNELEFLKLLSPMIGTPRAAKRLINVYRLLRVSLPSNELDRFVGSSNSAGEYQVAAILLAVLIGYPNQAALIFEELFGRDGRASWWGFVKDLRPEHENGRRSNSVDIQMTRAEAMLWERLSNCLERLLDSEMVKVPDELSMFQKWALLVSRFSFQTGHLMRSRGELNGAASARVDHVTNADHPTQADQEDQPEHAEGSSN